MKDLMTPEEQQEFVAKELRMAMRKLEGRVLIGGDTEALVRTQVDRTLRHLRDMGHIAEGSTLRVVTFGSLLPIEQERILHMYRHNKHFNGQPIDRFAHFSEDERRWLLTERWVVPIGVDLTLRKQATDEDGYVDWEEHAELVRAHPESCAVGDIENPECKVLMDYTVTPVYPINYIKVDITLEEKDG